MLLNLEALQQGLVVTLVGMGVVFSFLTINIFAMQIMSAVVKFLGKFFPEEVEVIVTKAKGQATSDDDIAVAIAVACVKNCK